MLLAMVFLGAAWHASATIPAGQVNDAGFGFVIAGVCAIVGVVLFRAGWAMRGNSGAAPDNSGPA